ncbi:MAG TPA: flagellar biosynthesis anti-sigma factor FlgM [Candidatus Sulfotelmatobacter sp.]
MRINPDHGVQILSNSSRSGTSARAESNQLPSIANLLSADQAQLSGAVTQVAALTAHALQLPEIRQERVQTLRDAVQTGNYAPNPQDVAAAILNSVALPAAA